MPALLTKDDHAALYRYRRNFSTAIAPERPDDIEELKPFGLRMGEFTEEEAREIAEVITRWLGLYPKRMTQSATFEKDDYLDYVFDMCERSRVPIIVLKDLFDVMVRNSRTLPSISEISDVLEERKQEALKQWKLLNEADRTYRDVSSSIVTALDKVLPDIRKRLPGFPEVDELVGAWRQLQNAYLGIMVKPDEATRIAKRIVDALNDGQIWPAIPFQLIWMAYGIPEAKRAAASAIQYRLCGDDDEKYYSVAVMEAVVKEVEMGVEPEEGCDTIVWWLSDIFSDLSDEVIRNIDTASRNH